MNIKIQARHLSKLIQESSPLILTGLGVVGAVGTAYLAAKGSFKASEVLRENQPFDLNNGEPVVPLTKKEKSLLIWKLYIPAVATGVMTVGCIVMSNRISARRAAAVAGAMGLLAKDYDEYRDKAREALGLKKADEVDANIAKGKLSKTPPPGGILEPGKTWFCDMSTMRYEPLTMETVKAGQNLVNYNINEHKDASLNDFYEAIGMEPTTVGDLLGWNAENRCELVFTPVLTSDRGAATAFKFAKNPVPKYWKNH